MFRCYFCQRVTPPKTKKHYVVIATREKQYPSRRRESKRPRGRFRTREEAEQDHGGSGTETAQEVPACPECADKTHESVIIKTEARSDAETVPSGDSGA